MNVTAHLPNATEFLTQADWDNHCALLHNYTPREAPASNPTSFPCIALDAGMSFHSSTSGPDLQHYAFIYDYAQSSRPSHILPT